LALSLVVGLGNPGVQYASTRHNVGFRAVEACAAHYNISFRKPLFAHYEHARLTTGLHGPVVFVKPLTFMNRSGEVIPRLMSRHNAGPDKMLVVCDNLDLECGRVRLKRGGGTAGHNGLKSVVAATESSEFYRLYIGIGRPSRGESVVDHVLGTPGEQEAGALEVAYRRASEIIRAALDGDLEQVMNDCNRRGA
jgi:peptidyl-tRNA hydrolase, PTH1 family